MSGLTLRAARRSEAKPLIGFYGKSKTGKTLSALFLARGYVGKQGKIVMIESESGRGEAHVDTTVGDSYVGGFEVISLREDFSTKSYAEAITIAEKSGAEALIVDSASHEWEGVGGVLHAAEMKREAGTKGQQVWTQAKIDHQRHFINRLLQTPIPLVILCMRAKEPMEEYLDDRGKKQLRRSGVLVPKQDHDILFEMFVTGYFDQAHGFHGEYTKPELVQIFPTGKPVTNATGEALARWARGEAPAAPAKPAEHSASLRLGLELIARAASLEELKKTGPAMESLTVEEKAIAKDAYKWKHAELSKAPE